MGCENGACWPNNLMSMQQAAAIKKRVDQIDQAVLEAHRDGYAVDADRLLDERLDLRARMAQLVQEHQANGGLAVPAPATDSG